MDTPRRWQVASLATAVASLGLGSALISRPSVEMVPTIDLDHVDASVDVTAQPDPAFVLDPEPVGPSIVLPRAFSTPTASATRSSVVSATSADDADPSTPANGDPPPSPEESIASADEAPATVSPTDSPASATSTASPESIDSSD